MWSEAEKLNKEDNEVLSPFHNTCHSNNLGESKFLKFD
jgi:hypothetical protein